MLLLPDSCQCMYAPPGRLKVSIACDQVVSSVELHGCKQCSRQTRSMLSVCRVVLAFSASFLHWVPHRMAPYGVVICRSVSCKACLHQWRPFLCRSQWLRAPQASDLLLATPTAPCGATKASLVLRMAAASAQVSHSAEGWHLCLLIALLHPGYTYLHA